jgi:hypothetical protein
LLHRGAASLNLPRLFTRSRHWNRYAIVERNFALYLEVGRIGCSRHENVTKTCSRSSSPNSMKRLEARHRSNCDIASYLPNTSICGSTPRNASAILPPLAPDCADMAPLRSSFLEAVKKPKSAKEAEERRCTPLCLRMGRDRQVGNVTQRPPSHQGRWTCASFAPRFGGPFEDVRWICRMRLPVAPRRRDGRWAPHHILRATCI